MDDKPDPSRLSTILRSTKESSTQSKDYYKFVIGLSTGTLLFSVTFIDKFGLVPSNKHIIIIGWVCLIISIIGGVWLLPRRDKAQSLIGTIHRISSSSKVEDMAFAIESNLNKYITRVVAGSFLQREIKKDPKNEELIKSLQKVISKPSEEAGESVLRKMSSDVKKPLPEYSTYIEDVLKVSGRMRRIIGEKPLYLPEMLNRYISLLLWMNRVEKLMTASFFTGIILITLFSAINFLSIDLIGAIRSLF